MKSNQPLESPLGIFMSEHKLTLRQLESLLENKYSRTTIHRLCHDKLVGDIRESLIEDLATVLPAFLVEKGVDKPEIDAAMLTIFEKGEYKPMINKRLELSLEAQKFFGLPNDPFSRAPQNREEVYIPAELQRVIDKAIEAIRFQHFIAITGEIGSGKSTLRALIEDHVLSNSKLHIVWPEFFDMNKVSPMQIAASILDSFGHSPIPPSAIKRGKVVKDLLAMQFKGDNRVAIAFDECHRLNASALSSLKNFFEMSSGGFQRYLAVILFGQPVFKVNLAKPQFREIYERLTVIEMPDFRQLAEGYLKHRLKLVDTNVKDLFDQEAIELICSQASTPLQLGNIANEALMISMSLKNKQVIGAAIRTKMFFSNRAQGFRKAA